MLRRPVSDNPTVDDRSSLGPKPDGLIHDVRGGQPTVGPHDPPPGNALDASAQETSHRSRRTGRTRLPRHVAVGHHLPRTECPQDLGDTVLEGHIDPLSTPENVPVPIRTTAGQTSPAPVPTAPVTTFGLSMSAVLRVHHALRGAGLDPLLAQISPQRIPNAVNEVWSFGDYIVRVNPDASSRRLQDEAHLLLYLPAGVRAPVPVAAGAASWGEWVVTVRLPGQELSRAWATMRKADRRQAVTELGHCLRALHGALPPAGFPFGDPERCPHPLPAERLMGLLAEAADLPVPDRPTANGSAPDRPTSDRKAKDRATVHGSTLDRHGMDQHRMDQHRMERTVMDPGVFHAAAERLADARAYLDDEATTLVHGDLHLQNVLSDGGELTGVLDFEWTRPGPPDLDLDVLLRSIADPSVHLRGGTASPLHRSDFEGVVGWLRAAYPDLFAHPHLAQRLWVYRLAYDVRNLLDRPGGDLSSPHHPYQRIVSSLRGHSEAGWFLTA